MEGRKTTAAQTGNARRVGAIIDRGCQGLSPRIRDFCRRDRRARRAARARGRQLGREGHPVRSCRPAPERYNIIVLRG